MGNRQEHPAEEEPLNSEENKVNQDTMDYAMSSVNINKKSIRLQPSFDPSKFYLTFSFDALVDCVVSVYYNSVVLTSGDRPISIIPVEKDAEVHTYRFSNNFGQQLPANVENLTQREMDRLESRPAEEMKYYPIVISIESTMAPKMIQYTLAAVEKGEVKVLKQLLQINEYLYKLEEFFGAEGKKEEDDEASKECVVCYSEIADTVVVPCRHLCLCKKCAQIVRMQTSKCPICRTQVKTFIHIQLQGADETQITVS
eukprot:TRINITY_DN4880_c0_g1_i1.p2 TRINITY_DN4880_c0_g1~~TRINITY_DN4880_c0_g1_i1.p2  ORF type:complete len:267 (-),score=48.06 TRINITY_DN4880_c0_g1_i1:33-800(-)